MWESDIRPIDTTYAMGVPNSCTYRTRSSFTIREEIIDRLNQSINRDLNDIQVDVVGSEVFLFGDVESSSTRLEIEKICDDVRGVYGITNKLKIAEASLSRAGATRESTPKMSTPKRPDQPETSI